jgi:hypothetical protein
VFLVLNRHDTSLCVGGNSLVQPSNAAYVENQNAFGKALFAAKVALHKGLSITLFT